MEQKANSGKGRDDEKLYKLFEGEPEAIVIHCADPRFQDAFSNFLSDKLALKPGSYVPIVISGAIASLTEPLSFPKEFKVLNDILMLFIDRYPSIKLVVMINHEDCRKYEQLKEKMGSLFLLRAKDIIERQKIDLKKIARIILDAASKKMDIKMYYAKFADDTHKNVRFEEIL